MTIRKARSSCNRAHLEGVLPKCERRGISPDCETARLAAQPKCQDRWQILKPLNMGGRCEPGRLAVRDLGNTPSTLSRSAAFTPLQCPSSMGKMLDLGLSGDEAA